eukprot:GEMP01006527.1.p1 GENE.GEMP01006527.1~~GEMP01006527.1.p1  ORF type:complete len:1058 (+),score=159.87 GEMP01006527.1:27-3176(+)
MKIHPSSATTSYMVRWRALGAFAMLSLLSHVPHAREVRQPFPVVDVRLQFQLKSLRRNLDGIVSEVIFSIAKKTPRGSAEKAFDDVICTNLEHVHNVVDSVDILDTHQQSSPLLRDAVRVSHKTVLSNFDGTPTSAHTDISVHCIVSSYFDHTRPGRIQYTSALIYDRLAGRTYVVRMRAAASADTTWADGEQAPLLYGEGLFQDHPTAPSTYHKFRCFIDDGPIIVRMGVALDRAFVQKTAIMMGCIEHEECMKRMSDGTLMYEHMALVKVMEIVTVANVAFRENFNIVLRVKTLVIPDMRVPPSDGAHPMHNLLDAAVGPTTAPVYLNERLNTFAHWVHHHPRYRARYAAWHFFSGYPTHDHVGFSFPDGKLCSSKNPRVGITAYDSMPTALEFSMTFAHEMGHMFGASHTFDVEELDDKARPEGNGHGIMDFTDSFQTNGIFQFSRVHEENMCATVEDALWGGAEHLILSECWEGLPRSFKARQLPLHATLVNAPQNRTDSRTKENMRGTCGKISSMSSCSKDNFHCPRENSPCFDAVGFKPQQARATRSTARSRVRRNAFVRIPRGTFSDSELESYVRPVALPEETFVRRDIMRFAESIVGLSQTIAAQTRNSARNSLAINHYCSQLQHTPLSDKVLEQINDLISFKVRCMVAKLCAGDSSAEYKFPKLARDNACFVLGHLLHWLVKVGVVRTHVLEYATAGVCAGIVPSQSTVRRPRSAPMPPTAPLTPPGEDTENDLLLLTRQLGFQLLELAEHVAPAEAKLPLVLDDNTCCALGQILASVLKILRPAQIPVLCECNALCPGIFAHHNITLPPQSLVGCPFAVDDPIEEHLPGTVPNITLLDIDMFERQSAELAWNLFQLADMKNIVSVPISVHLDDAICSSLRNIMATVLQFQHSSEIPVFCDVIALCPGILNDWSMTLTQDDLDECDGRLTHREPSSMLVTDDGAAFLATPSDNSDIEMETVDLGAAFAELVTHREDSEHVRDFWLCYKLGRILSNGLVPLSSIEKGMPVCDIDAVCPGIFESFEIPVTQAWWTKCIHKHL